MQEMHHAHKHVLINKPIRHQVHLHMHAKFDKTQTNICNSFIVIVLHTSFVAAVGGLIRHKGDPHQHPRQPQSAVQPEGRLPSIVVDQQWRCDQGHNVAHLPSRIGQAQGP